MLNKLTRDKEFISGKLVEKDSTYYTKDKLTIEFPSWYFDKKMGVFSEETHFFGVAALIIGGKYSVMLIPTICSSKPINITTITRGGMELTQLEFAPGDAIFTSADVIQETLLSYDLYNNFLIRSNVPWFIGYIDLVKILNNLVRYAGSNAGINPIANELVVSFLTRLKKDPDIYLRQGNELDEYVFVDLMNLFRSVASTTDKITGSYLEMGITSALVKQTDEVTSMEIHLKG